MQRGYKKSYLRDGYFELSKSKVYESLINNVKEEKYEIEYKLGKVLKLSHYDVNKDVIIKQYDILPLGENLVSSKEEIISSIKIDTAFPYKNLKLKDGIIFNSKRELENYIIENTTVDIEYNYRNSGRTKISIIYNLNEIDWSYYSNNLSRLGKFRNKAKSRDTI